MRKRFFREALLQITIPFLLKKLAPTCKSVSAPLTAPPRRSPLPPPSRPNCLPHPHRSCPGSRS